jgi:alkaline phosphatase
MNADDSTLIGLGCLAVVGLEKSTYADATTGEMKEKTKNIIKVVRDGWKMPVSQGKASASQPADAGDGFDPNNPPF